MGFFRQATMQYGPQARYEDPSLRKHNGPATPGTMHISYQNGSLKEQEDRFHCRDHDITVDQTGALQYIQILHDDMSVQIIRSPYLNIHFFPD